MNSIVVAFQPFSVNQNVIVYSDGDILEEFSVEMDKIVDVISGLKKQYNSTNIDLIGSEDYLTHFKTRLLSKFAEEPAQINIISR